MNTKPILIIEDDPDDREIIVTAFADIGVKNELKCFNNGKDALTYLKSSSLKTFMILSDINMPLMSGLELKKSINDDAVLKLQSIPFIFISTASSAKDVKAAYEMTAQGFFQKPSDFVVVKQYLKNIVDYWSNCIHPSSAAFVA